MNNGLNVHVCKAGWSINSETIIKGQENYNTLDTTTILFEILDVVILLYIYYY